MAEEAHYTAPKPVEEFNGGAATVEPVETTDRGLFGFGKKKEETSQYDQDAAIAAEFDEKVQVSEPVKEEKKGSLLSKLHRSGSSSSSSSSSDEEEVEEGGKIIKRKKKKGLKENIKEKIHGDKEKKHEEVDTSVPIEKYEEVVTPPPAYQEPPPAAYQEPVEEKKGFLEKIKDKLPGGKKTEEEAVIAPPPPTPVVAAEHHDTTTEVEAKEKKGIFEKIKEKIPGYHPKAEEEKKEKEGGSDY